MQDSNEFSINKVQKYADCVCDIISFSSDIIKYVDDITGCDGDPRVAAQL